MRERSTDGRTERSSSGSTERRAGDEEYVCAACGERFPTEEQLHRHVLETGLVY